MLAWSPFSGTHSRFPIQLPQDQRHSWHKLAPREFDANVRVPVAAKTPPNPPAPTTTGKDADATPEHAPSPFNRHFQAPRRPKAAREPSGRVLPPAPAWMAKPLKPPRAPSRD
ncbi:MAG TPA: hypothetical protein VLJ38_16740 [Polyangiaceae bacterium]|nr:hypothetical protein [Polyangiaceae bacterium]